MDRWTSAFGISFAITAILSAVLVVVKETSRGTFDLLASMTGHHWVTHGVLQLIVFVLLGFVFLRTQPASGSRLVLYVAGSLVLGSIIISGFFLLH